jgi:hypothetical protein
MQGPGVQDPSRILGEIAVLPVALSTPDRGLDPLRVGDQPRGIGNGDLLARLRPDLLDVCVLRTPVCSVLAAPEGNPVERDVDARTDAVPVYAHRSLRLHPNEHEVG